MTYSDLVNRRPSVRSRPPAPFPGSTSTRSTSDLTDWRTCSRVHCAGSASGTPSWVAMDSQSFASQKSSMRPSAPNCTANIPWTSIGRPVAGKPPPLTAVRSVDRRPSRRPVALDDDPLDPDGHVGEGSQKPTERLDQPVAARHASDGVDVAAHGAAARSNSTARESIVPPMRRASTSTQTTCSYHHGRAAVTPAAAAVVES